MFEVIRKATIEIGKIVIASILAILILSAISFFYSFSGIHIVNETGATDYKWQPHQWKADMSEGFSWLHMDRYGFNNTETVSDKVATIEELSTNRGGYADNLLMGSSHMEAVEVAQNKNTAALLNQSDVGTTYNIGTSGHTIYRCVDNLENVYKTYQPSNAVIIETDRVNLDVYDMQNVIEGTAIPIPSYDHGIVYQAQKIPGLKWVYKSITDWKNQGSTVNEEAEPKTEGISETYICTLNDFLEFARRSVPENVKIIIFYQPETGIDRDGTYLDQKDKDYRELFDEACSENNITFVDLTDDFRKLYDTKHILAHGYSNTAIGKGHLNIYGHQVIADRLEEVLKGGDN